MVGVFFCRLRGCLALALLVALVFFNTMAPTRAGDTAILNVLGFSSDGAIFAFEEYGIQNGSGFPYANRFYIDTASDTFVPGSPIRKRIEDDTTGVEDVRAQARADGQAIISDALLAANSGYLVGSNPVTELSANPHRIVVNPRPVHPPIDAPIEIRLEELPFAPSETCAGVSEASIGFRLTQIDPTPGGTTRLLSEDASVPDSRGCPLGYTIGGIQTYFPDKAEPVVAVLIAIRSFGFEGPDYRWMAVTATTAP